MMNSQQRQLIKNALSGVELLAILFVIAFGIVCAYNASALTAEATLWALFPPVVAIGLALVTKEVYTSLFVGLVAGGLLAGGFNPLKSMDLIINDGMISAISGQAGIFIFLVLLGIMISLINKAGGSAAFGRWAKTHIKTRTGAQLATFLFGILIFIDDYFNCLTVGTVMRPVTDSHRISRAKFAYLIDSTAAPICMIAPISSWAAAVSSYASDGEGIRLFCMAIPYNYYSLLTLLFIIGLAVLQFDYGPMREHEYNAIVNNDLITDSGEVEVTLENSTKEGSLVDLIFPIIPLIGFCVFALLYVGGIFDGADFVTAFSDTDATVALPWGATIAVVITVIYMVLRGALTFEEAMKAIPQGFNAMVAPILILTLATALKNMTALLSADVFVKVSMSGAAAGLQSFLPAIIFLVAIFIAFSTGTSWGTFGILIPIIMQVFAPTDPLYIIGISACLAGSVCGDHCSPISDTTIMSSAGAQCNHISHVRTQLPYALTVALVSFISFLFAGFVQNPWICLAFGAGLMLLVLFGLKMLFGRKENACSYN